MKTEKKMIVCLMVFSLAITGCKKYLETKPDSRLAVPGTAEDLQAMLDTYYKMSEQESALGETSADNFYLTTELWKGLASEDERNLYIWNKNVVFSNPVNDWYNLYEKVNYANAVIEAYDKFEPSEKFRSRDILGQALVFRASAFLNGMGIWAKAYDPVTASSDLGIPIRLNTNFNEPTKRSNVQQCYDQIIDDLKRAAGLLNIKSSHVIRPSKPAAFGFLSRTYLFMGDYTMAGKYADSCLQLRNDLLDYNELDTLAALPFSRFNTEVVFELASGSTTSIFVGNIDSTLYSGYSAYDLRRTLYFKKNTDNTYKYKGSYESHNSMLFWGIGTDEMFLTRAECFARLNKIQEALADLHRLLSNRIVRKNYVEYSNTDQKELLKTVLSERRKELVFRGLRWSDIKRLNKEKPEIILRRKLDGRTYELSPNDPRYALPIPENVIEITGITQN
ncbi:RagB/SusD family nutrient uptake outer membrane protein [Pedobacter sp. ISL-68]|uniref:RagB/SusD family nutrient uptake outer membrane protein n=1 Tax=unclassified Pedobacter TaxID=2628915 RepID=UPI001BE63314|nr:MULTISPECIES: RagB/SusD family nutrient uptake outer membrane protein [unclassified Pedobacter]MBT2560087.1 RagB/SusD family nutrient uptake outer membrane protein [Pedobacter sp. ISL-64]MBT2589066.1 RagB/SusD family nutrient uptake outer membrane protein [Pedobacter sp. ISL-68]